MSRVGNNPIKIPDKVKVEIKDLNVLVQGPKGKTEYKYNKGVNVEIKDNIIYIKVESKEKKMRALHGLTRALIANMICGVTEQFEKKLEIIGVGYRALLKGKDLELNIGKSHPIIFKAVEGIDIKLPDQTHIDISGISKQLVGQVAADIRAFYKPEPYKGKGIRYLGEYVRSKEGKTAK